jgi:alkanesulfonate monooxygenase SsuD/methylene tetrahydromethanopterin reductase-like flavin-dependent oxidoreductase (luciferase family)
MPDYGQELEFGLFPTPEAARLGDLLTLVQLAEVEGLDLVSIQDHPYQAKYLDTWTLLSVLGARTSTIRLAPNVTSLPLRPPVVLAKAAATLDLVTGGRVELGLGAGAFWAAIVAAGGPRRTPKEAVDALAEAVQILKAFWAGGTVRFEGEHYRAVGLHAGPPPAHDIPVWIGAYKPRMLRLTGRLADGWVPSMGYADPSALATLSRQVDEAAAAAGRAPVEIKRIYNITGRFGSGSGFLQGRPQDWAEQLAGLALDVGTSSFILGTDDPDDVRRFAAEVGPAVREQVASARSAPVVEPAHAEPERIEVDAPAGPTSRDLHGAGQHLVDVHDGLRAELSQIRDVLAQVRQGHLTVGQARSTVNTMTVRQNNWTLGAYCEAYCRFVTGHHTLEDGGIFLHLRRSDPSLGPVLDRLEKEHVTIHGVLEEFDRALVRLVTDDGTGKSGAAALEGVQRVVDELSETLLDHLTFEEEQLVGPLDRHGFA